MPQLLWDASALTKRYVYEVGTETVNALFAIQPALRMATTFLCYAEAAAIQRRRLNAGVLDSAAFLAARLRLESEVLNDIGFSLLTTVDSDVLAGIGLTDRHNLNSTDAAILAAFLRYVQAQAPESPTCVLVASDQRLLRAAGAEGMQTLNPETVAIADIEGVLAAIG